MVCLDTNILVDILRGDTDTIKRVGELEKTYNVIGTSSISAYELLKGAKISKNSRENIKSVEDLLEDLLVFEYDYKCADLASEIYTELKEDGIPISEFDVLIASICLANDETLVSKDTDFKKIKNLKFESW